MTLIREDDHGIYVKAGGYIARPWNGVLHVLEAYDLEVADAGQIFAMRALIVKESAFQAGDRAQARHIRGMPVTAVDKERWQHDPFTRYGPDSWDYEPVAQALATARVQKRRRLGEDIPDGLPFQVAHVEEMRNIMSITGYIR